MSKRKSLDIIDALQMSDEVPQLPRTPARGKRRRHISDVIDSMGHQYNSPASSSSAYSSATSTPSSVGFATPQQARAYWNTIVASPDQCYSTPEQRKNYVPDYVYKRFDSSDATIPNVDEEDHLFSGTNVLGNMSTHKDAERYNMEHRYRGKCVIFNHENFDTGLETREGSSSDVRRIEQTFQRLGFTIDICDDYEHSNITSKIKELSEEDHSENDCICIFVLTHGLKDDFIFAKDVAYKIDSIWKPFTADRCSTLAGKPKLFFFQACRGNNLDGGIRMQKTLRTETDSPTSYYNLPTHADFLFAHCTVQGFYSWRNPEEGTWYVQSLCDVIDEYGATTDLTKMLTITARKVATDFASYNDLDPSMHNQKQVPSITSMLIRDVYFPPKNE